MKSKIVTILICSCAAWSQQSGFGKASISIPGVTGALEIDAGPNAWEARVRPDGKEVQMRAMSRPDHLLISAFLQRVTFSATPEKCRDEWWPATEKGDREHHLKLEHLQKSSQDGIALVEYIIPEFQGAPVRQKSTHAYLGSGNLCAEIHLSKVAFAPEDQKLFDGVLATAHLRSDDASVQPSPTQPSRATEYLGQGSRYYLQHNYAAAAERYQNALDMEKQNRTLDQTMFRVLVDNLGMSYGISGDLSKAKETFVYGLTQDPQYPLFYYNLACTYAEMNKMDESLEQLRLAYKYKDNMIQGEGPLPDPFKDDSFRKFVKEPKFVQAVRAMQH